MFKSSSYQGFTLAEVLTTLMVIGVVAAMTIPTLLNSTDDQQHKVALKKAISVLSQAAQLNIAKEYEQEVTSSAQLCQYFANSMSGTCSSTDNNKDDIVTMTTPDGIVYGFSYRGNAAEDDTSFETICGDEALSIINAASSAASSQKKKDATNIWAGKGAKCVVIVDTNGAKGTPSIDSNDSMKKGQVAKGPHNVGNNAIAATYFSHRDQFPLIITSRGIYPAIAGTETANESRGYRYVYGDSAKSPWGADLNTSSTH